MLSTPHSGGGIQASSQDTARPSPGLTAFSAERRGTLLAHVPARPISPRLTHGPPEAVLPRPWPGTLELSRGWLRGSAPEGFRFQGPYLHYLVTWESCLVLKRYLLKYFRVEPQNACNLFSDGSDVCVCVCVKYINVHVMVRDGLIVHHVCGQVGKEHSRTGKHRSEVLTQGALARQPARQSLKPTFWVPKANT